jgi:murein DD-endopeptidase MepM/ murein hydrolase activator NlpD
VKRGGWDVVVQSGATLFKARDQVESGSGGPAPAAAALTSALLLESEAIQPSGSPWVERVFAWAHPSQWVHDLAEDIGSHRWFRGLGAMLGLTAAALAFWPNFSAVGAAPVAHVDSSARDELRSQMIMPLAYGGDSGRRMGATAMVVPANAVPERTTVQMIATLAAGDSFGLMLQRAGVGAADAARANELVATAVPLDKIAPGTRVAITLGRRSAPGQPRPLDKLDFRASFDLSLALSRRGEGFALTRQALQVDTTPLRIRGVAGSSLYRSARAAGAPLAAVQQYLQALDANLGLDAISPDDEFDMIVAYKRSAGGESEPGQLLFAGLDQGGRARVQLVRIGGALVDASEGATSAEQPIGGMVMPVAGHLTSGFGLRRHPILGYTRMHSGVDFGAAWGSPIHAVASGIVSYAGRHGGHGNYVRIEHGGGLGSGYGHMSRIAVAPGTRVQAGQVIGYVGSTGLSTGPHLHYEVYANGRTVNPLGVRFAGVAKIQPDPKQQSAFKARIAQLKAVKPGAALASLAPKQAFAKH